MQIPFSKIAKNGDKKAFRLAWGEIEFAGELSAATNSSLVALNGEIKGDLAHRCDLCGEDLVVRLDERIKLFISQGTFKDSEGELSDTVEMFGDQIDLAEILNSEIENIKSDYFYCDSCKSKRS